MPKRMHFSRRQEGITNYRKRLALLKSGVPRAVVRFTNSKVMIQIIDFSTKGDNVLASATSNDLTGMGWKSSEIKATKEFDEEQNLKLLTMMFKKLQTKINKVW